MTKKVLIFCGIFLCSATIWPTIFVRPSRTDLSILVNAAQHLLDHKTVYDLNEVNEHTKPPLATFLSIPVARFQFYFGATLLWRIWDLLNLAGFPLLAYGLARQLRSKHPFITALGALVILLNPWNSEIRLGQYNVLLFLAILWSLRETNFFTKGIGIVLAVLFKPTNLFLLPWLLKYSAKTKTLILSALFFVLVLAASYAFFFGGEALLADHHSWLAALPISAQKHLLRIDNYGLPTLWAETFSKSLSSTGLVAGGFLLSCLIVQKTKDAFLSLALVSTLAIMLSPMAWLQNFTGLLPLVLFILVSLEAKKEDKITQSLGILSLALVYVALEIFNPTTCRANIFTALCFTRIRTWSLLFSFILLTLYFRRKSNQVRA